MSSSNNNVDADMLKTMLEMGYSREDASIALGITGNKLDQACNFLVNNPNPSADIPGLQA